LADFIVRLSSAFEVNCSVLPRLEICMWTETTFHPRLSPQIFFPCHLAPSSLTPVPAELLFCLHLSPQKFVFIPIPSSLVQLTERGVVCNEKVNRKLFATIRGQMYLVQELNSLHHDDRYIRRNSHCLRGCLTIGIFYIWRDVGLLLVYV